MSFTRIHDDPVRIAKQVEEWTFQGRYQLATPGQGDQLPFSEDAQLRLQRWGANLRTNTIGLESDLLGLTRRLGCDSVQDNDFAKHAETSTLPAYTVAQPWVEESRASHPAWMYRDMEHPRWEFPWVNPQANLEKRFPNNLQTRILEKDRYVPTASVRFP